MTELTNLSTTQAQATPAAAPAATVAPVSAPVAAEPARKKSFSESLAEEENMTLYETDAAGRRIGVQKLDFLATHRLTIMMGPADAANAIGLQQVMMAAMVTEIDGIPVSRPKTKAEIEALMKRLNFHGIVAAQKAFNRFTSVSTDNEEDASGGEAAVKN